MTDGSVDCPATFNVARITTGRKLHFICFASIAVNGSPFLSVGPSDLLVADPFRSLTVRKQFKI